MKLVAITLASISAINGLNLASKKPEYDEKGFVVINGWTSNPNRACWNEFKSGYSKKPNPCYREDIKTAKNFCQCEDGVLIKSWSASDGPGSRSFGSAKKLSKKVELDGMEFQTFKELLAGKQNCTEIINNKNDNIDPTDLSRHHKGEGLTVKDICDRIEQAIEANPTEAPIGIADGVNDYGPQIGAGQAINPDEGPGSRSSGGKDCTCYDKYGQSYACECENDGFYDYGQMPMANPAGYDYYGGAAHNPMPTTEAPTTTTTEAPVCLEYKMKRVRYCAKYEGSGAARKCVKKKIKRVENKKKCKKWSN